MANKGDAMTSGERMLFAAAFVAAEAEGLKPTEAVRSAVGAVDRLRDVRSEPHLWEELDGDERAMLDDMLGVPR